MSSPKEIAIRVWGLLFALTFGVAWMVIGLVPMFVTAIVGNHHAVDRVFQIWFWPMDLANSWMNYGREER